MHGVARRDSASITEDEKKLVRQKVEKYVRLSESILQKRAAEEYDESSLKLSGQMLEISPDFYTLYNYRRECILHLMQDCGQKERSQRLVQELALTERALMKNPKSYCAWHHRAWVVEHGFSDLDKEIALCTLFLKKDARNFHCWDYRRFVVKLGNFSLKDEFAFTVEKICENISNYSAWHYRSTLVPKVFSSIPNMEELHWIKQALYTDPFDQSAWLYLKWFLSQLDRTEPEVQSVFRQVLAICDELVEEEPHAKYAYLTSAYLMQRLNIDQDSKKLREIYTMLITIDPPRSGYYRQCRDEIH